MNNKHIIVIEDSSQNKFGGGQKISLYVMKFLKVKYKILLFDTVKKSLFIKKAEDFSHEIFYLYGNNYNIGSSIV